MGLPYFDIDKRPRECIKAGCNGYLVGLERPDLIERILGGRSKDDRVMVCRCKMVLAGHRGTIRWLEKEGGSGALVDMCGSIHD